MLCISAPYAWCLRCLVCLISLYSLQLNTLRRIIKVTCSSWITARLLFRLGAPLVKGGNPRADLDSGTILLLVPGPAPVSRSASPCAPERWRSHRRHSPDRGCQYSGRGHTNADRSDAGGKTSRDSGYAPGLSEEYVLEPPPDRGLRGSTRRRYVPQVGQ